jgi:HlyD family secretion protein
MLHNMVSWIRRHPIWSIIIALVTASVLWSILAPKPAEYEYITEAVENGDVVRSVSASGKLRALNTIKVGAEVSGQITDVYVDFNSPVTKGQVLAVIDPTRVNAQVNQVEAQVTVAQASLQQAQANVARAQTDLVLQEREYNRRRSLAAKGFVSKAALDIAAGQVNAARNAVRVSQTQVSSSSAQIRQANAQLSSAQLDRSRTKIIAPASGVIINKLVEPGTTVAASFQTPNLFEIAADITKMQVEASVDEADIGQVKEGQSVSFTVDSHPDEIFRAVVRQVRKAPVETQNVVSYLVIIDVDNVAGKLLPGMTANVEIITSLQPSVTRVPSSALRFRPRKADLPDAAKDEEAKDKKDNDKKPDPVLFIATADPYKPAMRKVKIGIQGDEYTQILAGVKRGEKILVRNKSLKPKPETESSADEDDDAAS